MTATDIWQSIGLIGLAVLVLATTSVLIHRIRLEDPELFDYLGSPDFSLHKAIATLNLWKWIYSWQINKNLSAQTRIVVWVVRLIVPIYLILLFA